MSDYDDNMRPVHYRENAWGLAEAKEELAKAKQHAAELERIVEEKEPFRFRYNWALHAKTILVCMASGVSCSHADPAWRNVLLVLWISAGMTWAAMGRKP